MQAQVRSTLTALLVCSFVVACSSTSTDSTSTKPAVDPVANSDNKFRIGRPLVIPHGGGDGLFPENTMYAYEQSQALGGDVIDIDVKVAADGVLVAFHDPTLDRTTEATGPVTALTSTELAQLDAGYDFEVDGTFPFRGQGIGVPTVEEIMRAFPDTLTTIDLKTPGAEPVQPVCDLLRRLGRSDDVYVGTESNDQPTLFRATCPEIHTSGTSEERQQRRAALEAGETSSPIAQLVSQPPLIGDDGKRRITEESLAFAHNSGTAVFAWVIDDRATMEEFIEMGIDGIYTRRPDLMVELLEELGLVDVEVP
jgi:glycerophosphoryl diester phosphodiesterase